MLQTIHDRLKGIFAIVILVALGIVFVFWGVEVNVGGFTRARGIEVNGREIAVEEVRRAYQEELSRYQAAFGAAGVPEEVRGALRTNVVERAVQAELVRQKTTELDYAASDAAVLASIRQIPAFQVAGQFSADAYHAALRSIGMSPERFEAEQRQYVLAAQLDRAVAGTAFVLPGEFERQVRLRQEAREIAWATVPAASFTDQVTLDEAAIQAWYDAHQDRYMTEERATVEYVELDIDAFAEDVAIGEEQLREYYRANRDRYTTPGRRHARHLLFTDGAEGDDGRARAQSALERVRAGENFAALARELSEDPGSRESGGDLGWMERADLDPAFAAAVWAMAPGEVRGPVESAFGWHVIRLEEIQPEVVRSFEEIQAELAEELRLAEVEQAFGDRQEELDTLAFEAAGDLDAVAAGMGLPVQRVEGFTRSGGGALGTAPELISAVFDAQTLAGRELRTVELERGRVVAVGVAAHEPARARPLEEIRPLVVNAARLERAQQLALERARAVAEALRGGQDWEEAIRPWRAESGPARLVRRDDAEVPPAVADDAFRAPVPEGQPRYGVAGLGSGDAGIWRLTAVRAGSLAALSPAEREQSAQYARERAEAADAVAYGNALRAGADVDVNPQVFE